jgi:hypothetical protein
VSSLTVHTPRRAITIHSGGDTAFQFLAASPQLSARLTPASITIEGEGTFHSATWHGIEPAFLTRTASARDLTLQLDCEIAAQSLQDAEPDVLLAGSILHWRGRRLLLLGPGLPRTALALTLYSQGVDIEGDWMCRQSPGGITALPRSVRWDARLLRAFPDIAEASERFPSHRVDSFHGELKAWSPATAKRLWICRDGAIDGIVVADNKGGGRSLARRMAPDFVWGHLMAARRNGNGGAALAAELKTLSTATPAIKLSVGYLGTATDAVMEFFRTLVAQSSCLVGVARQGLVC